MSDAFCRVTLIAKPGYLIDASVFFGNAFKSQIESISGAELESVSEPSEAIEFTVVSDSMPPTKAPNDSERDSVLEGLHTEENNQTLLYTTIFGSLLVVGLALSYACLKVPAYMRVEKKPVDLNGTWADKLGETYVIEYPFIRYDDGDSSKVELYDQNTVVAYLRGNLETGVLNNKWNKIVFESGITLTKVAPAFPPLPPVEFPPVPSDDPLPPLPPDASWIDLDFNLHSEIVE